MAKKKGFTLLELLAVIVIMVIILIIFAPNVLKIINNSQADTYLVKEKLIVRAGEDYVLLNNITLPTVTGEETLVNISNLINGNFINKIYDLSSPSDECKGYFIAKKNSTYGHTYEACLFCDTYQTDSDECNESRLDTPEITVPTLIVRGDNPYYLELGRTYVDPGCSAYTAGNQNVSRDVVPSGLGFDVNSIGPAHTITYTLPSAPGLSATRSVVIIDTTSPTVVFGTNSNTTPSKTKSTTVTSTDAAGLSSLKYVWSASRTAPSDASFVNTFTSGATITGSGLNGTQYLWIYSKDVNNNITRSRSGEFIFDNTAPTVTSAVIASNNGLNNKQAKNGNTVTLDMTFSEDISNTPTVTIGTRTATVSGSGTSWTATYTIPSAEATMTEGNLAIKISGYNDAAGNVGNDVTSVTGGGTVNYDRTPPVYTSFYVGGTGNPDYIGTVNTVLALSVSGATEMCISNISTCSSWETYASSKAWTLTSGEGLKIVYVWFRDAADNRIGSYSDTITLDISDPSGTIVINSDATYTKTISVTLTLTSSADTTEMCISTSSASPCSGTWETFVPSKAWTLASGDGTKKLYVWFRDGAYNVKDTYADSDSIILDTTPPPLQVATIVSNNTNNKYAKNGDTLTLNMTFSESLGTAPTVTIGGRGATVSGSGTSWQASYAIPSAEASLAEGALSINISGYKDAAGNTGNTVTSVTGGGLVTYDRTPPTGTVVINSGATYATSTSVTLAFTSSADIDQICISTSSSSCNGSWVDYVTPKTWVFTAGEGARSVYIWYKDLAGNLSTTYATDSIIIDTVDPTVTEATIVSNNTNNKYAKNGDTLTLSMTFSESLGTGPTVTIGTRAATVGGSGTSWTATYLIPAGESTLTQGSLGINISGYKDAATNAGSTVTNVTSGGLVTYDRTPPTGTVVINGGATYATSTSVTLTMSASDATSGMDQMCISTSSSSPCSGTWVTYATSYAYTLASGDTTKPVYVWFKDNSGNPSTTYATDSIILDTTLPTVQVATIVSDNDINTKQAKNGDTLTLNMTFSESLATAPVVTIGGRSATESGSGTTWTATYLIPAGESTLTQGSLEINISGYKDAAGNTGSTVTSVTSGGLVNYDRTSPVYTSFYIGGSGVTRVGSQGTTLYFSVSGATEMCIKNGVTSCAVGDAAWETYAASKAWTLTSGYGTKTVDVWFRDQAANIIGLYSDTVEYMQGDHSSTYTCKASAYSYDGTSSWIISDKATVIQGDAIHSNYYGIMYFDLSTIRNVAQDYSVDQITFTITNNGEGGNTKVTYLYVGSCPTLSYTSGSDYSIGSDGPGSGNKPTAIGSYVASTATSGTDPAVFTIDGSNSWVTNLLSASSECLYINREGSSYYWEGNGSKTSSPPSMVVSWLLKS